MREPAQIRQPPRLEAAGNGRALFSTVHTACHRNLRLEKTEMQGSWTVSAAPHQQTEAIGAAVIDSAEPAKGPMLPAARWWSDRRDTNGSFGDLHGAWGAAAQRPGFSFSSWVVTGERRRIAAHRACPQRPIAPPAGRGAARLRRRPAGLTMAHHLEHLQNADVSNLRSSSWPT